MTISRKQPPPTFPFQPVQYDDIDWKRYTSQAIELYHNGKYEEAACFYLEAHNEAKDLFASCLNNAFPYTFSVVDLLVTSTTNCSENHIQRGDLIKAADVLISTIRYLTDALNNKTTPIFLAQESALRLEYLLNRFAFLSRHSQHARNSLPDVLDQSLRALYAFKAHYKLKH